MRSLLLGKKLPCNKFKTTMAATTPAIVQHQTATKVHPKYRALQTSAAATELWDPSTQPHCRHDHKLPQKLLGFYLLASAIACTAASSAAAADWILEMFVWMSFSAFRVRRISCRAAAVSWSQLSMHDTARRRRQAVLLWQWLPGYSLGSCLLQST